MEPFRILRLVVAACGMLVVPLVATAARAQALSVLPVTIQMVPGQMAAALTVANQGSQATAFQVRPFTWEQPGGNDQLIATKTLLASPPLGTIAAGASQVIRLVLRRPAVGHETSYRILLDEIPPPAAPGTVRIALRLSIPIFAEPATRVVPRLRWRVQDQGGHLDLVATNEGSRHETVRDITLRTADGRVLKAERNVSPYVLVGATRRWRILTNGTSPPIGATLRLTAEGDLGPINQPVTVIARR